MFLSWGLIRRKQISTVLVLVLGFLILGLGILNKLSPTIDISQYRTEIFQRLNQALQRKFSTQGPIALKISLKPTVVMQQLTIENSPWAKGAQFLMAEQVEIGIDVLDMLLGKTTLDRVILRNATINLEQKDKTLNNWTFGKPQNVSETKKSGGNIRLDYVVLDKVKINYLSPEQNKKFNINDGLLRRSLRGRYYFELNSKLADKKLAIQLHSNRWFNFPSYRPLELKIQAELGNSQFQTEAVIRQLSPGLKAEIKLTSPLVDLDELEGLLSAKKKKQPVKKVNFLDTVEAWIKSVEQVQFEADIAEVKKSQHRLKEIHLKQAFLFDKGNTEHFYSVQLDGEINNIINLKDQRKNLFGVSEYDNQGRLNIKLKSTGKTAEDLIAGAALNLGVENFSGNRPHSYAINQFFVEMDNDRRLRYKGKAVYRDSAIEFAGRSGKDFFNALHKKNFMRFNTNFTRGSSKANVYVALDKFFSDVKKIDLRVNGTDMGEWSAAYGKKLPLIDSYIIETQFDMKKVGIKSRSFSFKSRDSNLKGKFFYRYGKPAVLNMLLKDSYLAISDLQRTKQIELPPEQIKKKIQPVDTDDAVPEDDQEKPGPMVIPDTDLMSLLSPTTEVNFEFKSSTVAFKKFTVTELDLKTRWKDKVFATEVTAGKLAKGLVTSDIYLTEVDKEAAGKIEFKVKQLDYGRLMQEMKIGDKMKGTADVNINLVGFGKSLREFLTHSDGVAEFVGEKGVLASKYLKLWGEDIAQYILPFSWFESEQTQLNCVVGRFDLTDGRLSSDSLLIDTEGMTIAGTGAIDLNTEKLAIELMPDPKNISLISLATPVKIRGTMARPKIVPHTLGTTWTIGSLLAGLANPAILIARFAKLGSLGENPCLAAVGKKEGEEEETSVLKMFKDAVKFIQRPLDKVPDLE